MPIELDCVSYSYKSNTDYIHALRGVSLKIDNGEFVGIMGHTGCGKTTLIQIMAGLLNPTFGSVLFDGRDINDKSYNRNNLREGIGLVFQYPEYQLFETTVERDVAFGLKHSGLYHSEIKNRVKWALETMDFSFDTIRSQSPLSLSGGEKRRVAIAGVIVTKPRILIFDEPIAGLDPLNRQSFLQTVTRLNQEGTTIIMVSHNADALGEYAKRLLVFDNGKLAIDGTVKDIFSNIDRLKALHLNASVPRVIGDMLSCRNIPIPSTVTTYNELLSALKSRFIGGDSP